MAARGTERSAARKSKAAAGVTRSARPAVAPQSGAGPSPGRPRPRLDATGPEVDLRPLPAGFFRRPTLDVARGLLGRLLVHRVAGGLVGGWIVEVEAYVGEDDPACHAAAGRTDRNAVMYGPPAHAYVYFTYGMHHCVNVVTGRVGAPEAVLIRAIEPAFGLARMRRRRGAHIGDRDLARGPGRLCQALGIDRRLNGAPLVGLDPGRGEGLHLARGRKAPRILGVSARIGIRVGTDRPWRFFDAESPWVSTPSAARRRLSRAVPPAAPK